ncbi:olfactory receptor 688-like [Rhinatrema bivittatum]|uniref:olfactory receptor 688-like n=1 Tax=Rhinatrema bivittatum TaxID=194408 RepID=UPI001125D62D|nr:olfactory receptor 688-like [Rhinatrema bivittatum]
MSSFNASSTTEVSEFLLMGFSGIQSWQHWLSIPLALLFLVALVANLILLITFYADPNLHEPMYYFLAMLALVDIGLCTSIMPKILGILWFGARAISHVGCFTQIFVIYWFVAMESSVFVIMAFDRYVAICNPLRYLYIITNGFVAKSSLLALARITFLILPIPFFLSKLCYSSRNVIYHLICSHFAVTSLACSDTSAANTYRLAISWIVGGMDLVLILLSYCLIIRAVLALNTQGAAVKALSTCGSHFILISFFYTILVVLTVTHRDEKEPSIIPLLLNVLHDVIPPALNPIVYGVRTKEIKQGMRKVFRISKGALS